jgi:hypothetical protein
LVTKWSLAIFTKTFPRLNRFDSPARCQQPCRFHCLIHRNATAGAPPSFLISGLTISSQLRSAVA